MRNTLWILVTLVLLTCSCPTLGQTPSWLWAHPFSTQNSGQGGTIKLGPSGDAFVGGKVSGYANFNGLVSNGAFDDPFVGRVDAAGNWQWIRRAAGNHYGIVTGLDVAANGDVVIGGEFGDTLLFGTTQLVDPPGVVQPGGFVARLDESGTWLWAMGIVSPGISKVSDVAFAPDGTIAVCGVFTDTVIVSGDTLITDGPWGAFLGRLDAAGNWLWIQKLDTHTADFVPAVDVNSTGIIALGGTYDYAFTLADTTLPAASLWQGFIAQFEPGGDLLWVRTQTSNGASFVRALAFDDQDHLFVAGDYWGTAMVIGDTTHSNMNSSFTDMWVAKYDSAGTALWSRTAGGSDRDWPRGLDLGNDLVVVSVASRSDTVWFGALELVTTSWLEPVVVALDMDGNWLWAKAAGTSPSGYGEMHATAPLADGSILAVGTSSGPMEFDGHPWSSGSFTGFLGKLGDLGTAVPSASATVLELFHDPDRNAIAMTGELLAPVRVSIHDLMGSLITQRNVQPSEGGVTWFPLPDVASGVYVVRVEGRAGAIGVRIPIVHW